MIIETIKEEITTINTELNQEIENEYKKRVSDETRIATLRKIRNQNIETMKTIVDLEMRGVI